MIAISIQHGTIIQGGDTVLRQMHLEVYQGDRLGVVGRNGSGKSTLLRVMDGSAPLDQGTVSRKKGFTVGRLRQRPVENDETTVANVLQREFHDLYKLQQELRVLEQQMADLHDPKHLEQVMHKYGMKQDAFHDAGGYEMERRMRSVSAGLGIEHQLTSAWSTLSGGERTKVGLACLLLRQPDVLLLDEPTNHLDVAALEWLAEYIHHYPGTVVLVSHDRSLLADTATRIADVEDQSVTLYESPYHAYVQTKEENLMRQFQQYEDQQKKIKKMKQSIKQLKEWANRANPPNAGMHRQAKSMEKALAKMEVLPKPVLHRPSMRVQLAQSQRTGNDVVTMIDIAKQWDQTTLFHSIDMHIRMGERVAIVGANGSGKTTLMRILTGEIRSDKGIIDIGSNVCFGRMTQHMETFHASATVLEAFRDTAHVDEGQARNILAQFLFYGADVFKRTHDLSGGERTRLRIAQMMYEDINVLVLDEPTNHLDIESQEALEEALKQFPGTIITISHDRYFLNQLFTVTYWLDSGVLQKYEGTYAYAVQKRQEAQLLQRHD